MDRAEAIGYRIRAQQLDRPTSGRALTDAAVFDFGVQDTGRDGASWALANRGVPVSSPAELEGSPDVALAWTLRSSPHFYRRADLTEVMVATSPFSDRDAAKRLVGAAKPMTAAGIQPRQGLAEVAQRLHDVVAEPLGKGEVSTRLTEVLDEPYLRNCVPCGALHCWESSFRLGALYGGLELTPGTAPPVLRRISEWPQEHRGPAEDPLRAPTRLQVIRTYLRLLGPAEPRDVAAFLDAPVNEIKAHWPEEAVATSVEGRTGWLLPDAVPATPAADLVRLLGPYDLLLQGRDRDLLVPDASRHKGLWPVIGRPGAVLVGTELAGTWRPRAAGARLSLSLDLWRPLSPATRSAVEVEAERLAGHRGVRLSGLEW